VGRPWGSQRPPEAAEEAVFRLFWTFWKHLAFWAFLAKFGFLANFCFFKIMFGPRRLQRRQFLDFLEKFGFFWQNLAFWQIFAFLKLCLRRCSQIPLYQRENFLFEAQHQTK
jgi:hypothetical protein